MPAIVSKDGKIFAADRERDLNQAIRPKVGVTNQVGRFALHRQSTRRVVARPTSLSQIGPDEPARMVSTDPHILPQVSRVASYESTPNAQTHFYADSLFYRATLILLHRPGCCSDVPGLDQKFKSICLHAAEEIHELLQLHGRTFAYRNLLYSKWRENRSDRLRAEPVSL